MSSMKTVILAFGLAVISPAVSYAADVPQTTGAFVQFCSDKANWSACEGRMLTDESATDISLLLDDTQNECDIPSGIKTSDANAAIIAWLANHNDYDAMPIHEGMQAAMRGMWNCATKLDTGKTSTGAPDKIGAFMTFCDVKENYKTCADEIVTGDYAVMASTLSGPSSHCSSPDNMTTEELTAKTLAWLHANPQPDNEDTSDAILAAHDALWPCH